MYCSPSNLTDQDPFAEISRLIRKDDKTTLFYPHVRELSSLCTRAHAYMVDDIERYIHVLYHERPTNIVEIKIAKSKDIC